MAHRTSTPPSLDLSLLDLPPGLTARPMRADDAGRWADLLAAVEEADRVDVHHDVADCVEELADPQLDLRACTVIVLDGRGAAVAFQILHDREGPDGRRAVSEAAVHPAYRRRGIGTGLLSLGSAYVRQVGGSDLSMRPFESNVGAVALAESSGMRPVRWWFDLERDLGEPVVPVPAPDGVTISALGPGYDAARWDGPLLRAHNAAFADHWGSVPESPEGWTHWRTGTRAFRPACSTVAVADRTGEPAGYLLAYEYEADTARTGRRDLYVGTVGTRPEHRGRGIAGALLAHALRAAAEQGCARATLTVDAQNATGALGVYERAGFREARRATTYALDIVS